jgi:glucans biosynthesis protein
MMGDRPGGNSAAMQSSRRCGAKTRAGKPCRAPAARGKKRCRMHGGAPGTGAPRGNKNALRHGRFTREAIEERRQLQALLRQSRKLVQQIE